MSSKDGRINISAIRRITKFDFFNSIVFNSFIKQFNRKSYGLSRTLRRMKF
jgi:hypothetical protein